MQRCPMSHMGQSRQGRPSPRADLCLQRPKSGRKLRGAGSVEEGQSPTRVPIAESRQTHEGAAETLFVFLDGLDKIS